MARVYSFRKRGNVQLETNLLDQYNIDLEDQNLREEIREETEFIERHRGSRKDVEIPHPSDIFVKYNQISSCPKDQLGKDYLILIEFLSFYFEMRKERVI
jgi:ferritin-like protein